MRRRRALSLLTLSRDGDLGVSDTECKHKKDGPIRANRHYRDEVLDVYVCIISTRNLAVPRRMWNMWYRTV